MFLRCSQLQLIQLRRPRGIPKAPGAGSPSSPALLAGLWSPGSCLCARALAWGSHPDKTRQIQTKPHIQPLLRLGPRAPFVPPTMNIRQGAVPQASILGVHWLADVFFSDAFVGLFITSGQGFCSPVHGSCLPYRTADQESPQSPPQ